MNGTFSNASTHDKAITLADIQKAKDLINSMPAKQEWVLVSPDGRVWKGTADELMLALSPYHSLLKLPTLEEILQQGLKP